MMQSSVNFMQYPELTWELFILCAFFIGAGAKLIHKAVPELEKQFNLAYFPIACLGMFLTATGFVGVVGSFMGFLYG